MKTNVHFEEHNLDPSTTYIKIHGLQRSGTNYLTFLINNNFLNTKALVNLAGWKHGPYMAPWAIGDECHILTIVKNPYAWLVSVYNYWGPNRKYNVGPDLRGVSFDTFVKNRILSAKQRDVPFLIRASNPVQLWNNMNYHWWSIRVYEKKSCIITYEKLMQDKEYSLNWIGEIFGLKRKYDYIVDSDKYFIPGGEKTLQSEEKFKKQKYYENKEYLKYYTPELIDFVNRNLDLELMINFGYKFIEPDEIEKKLC